MCRRLFFLILVFLLIGMILTGVAEAAEPNLVGWWKFDECSGITAYDSAGGNHGTIHGAEWTLGRVGYALKFDGLDDYVEVNGVYANGSTGMTWSVWFEFEEDGKFVLDQRESGTGYQPIYIGKDSYSGDLQFYSSDTGDNSYFDTNLQQSNWYHVAMVLNDSNVFCYVDGLLFDSKSDTNYDFGTKDLFIGARHSISSFFKGVIDDVRVYDRALTIHEIKQLYQNTDSSRATEPSPGDGAVGVTPDSLLSWLPGDYAVSHDVYFGTSYDDVNDAISNYLAGDVNSDGQVDWYDVSILNGQWLGDACGLEPSADLDGDGEVNFVDFAIMSNQWKERSVYRGNQDANSYDPGSLKIGQSYYWRIDEVNDTNVWEGQTWDFTVIPRIAYNPSPADEVNEPVRPDNTLTLSWSPGIDANSHNVYLGTDYNDVNDANTILTLGVYKGNQDVNSYGPFGPELGATYYWRIDEVNGTDVWRGDIWSFTAVQCVELGVMSFNIKNDEGYPSSTNPDAWIYTEGTDRKDRVIDMILSESVAFGPNGPDIVGVQEALNNQVDDLQSALSDYNFYGVGRNDGVTDGEYSGIFYRSSRFSRTDQGTFWLSETPDVPGSKYPGSNINVRIASWAVLYDNMTEQSYFVLNTHWENDSQEARLWSAELIRQRIKSLSGGLPLIVMGDLNCYEDSEEFLELIGENDPIGFQLLDSYREVYPVRQSDERTSHGWSGGTSGSRIDFVLHSAYFEAIGATIERATVYDRYPSDHYPVTATFYMQAAGTGE